MDEKKEGSFLGGARGEAADAPPPVESPDNEGPERELPELRNMPPAWKSRAPIVSHDADRTIVMQSLSMANALQARRAATRGSVLGDAAYKHQMLARSIVKIGGQKVTYQQVMTFLDAIGKANYSFLHTAAMRLNFIRAEHMQVLMDTAKHVGPDSIFTIPAEAVGPRWSKRTPIVSLDADRTFTWRDATVGEEIELDMRPGSDHLDAMLQATLGGGEVATKPRSELLDNDIFRKVFLSIRTVGGKPVSDEQKAQWAEDLGWQCSTILTTIFGMRSKVPEDDRERFLKAIVEL